MQNIKHCLPITFSTYECSQFLEIMNLPFYYLRGKNWDHKGSVYRLHRHLVVTDCKYPIVTSETCRKTN